MLLTKEEPSKLTVAFAHLVVCDECSHASEAEDHAMRERLDFHQRLRGSRLPSAFHSTSWGDLDLRGGRAEIVAAAKAWALHGGGLVLCGPVGTGKTRLAATAALAILRSGGRIRWVSAPELLTMAGASYTSNERRVALSLLLGRDPLVLDDLDRLHTGESSRGFLLAALDGRINTNAPMLITTNLRPSQIGERLGEPIMSRVAGHYFQMFELAGEDRRLDD